MAIQSMTGFARHEGEAAGCRFVWELRSVNGKGLDLRLRLPPGFEALEQPVRKAAAAELTRGNVQIALSVSVTGTAVEAVVNEAALEAVIGLVERLGKRIDARKPALDGILNIRGVLEFRDPELSDADRIARDQAVLAGFKAALDDLKAMRLSEGVALSQRPGRADRPYRSTHALPSRRIRRARPMSIRTRLAEQVAALMGTQAPGSTGTGCTWRQPLLATKADLREEIDRLKAHVDAPPAHVDRGAGRRMGRRLDFLAQEFNRETNTICSKSNAGFRDCEIGLDLKVLIDQFREQVQNLE
jgi:uncharacterized protein (TIGR00255 family)